jgi:hypothetical protein
MALVIACLSLVVYAYAGPPLSVSTVSIPGGAGGIGFDDLSFSPELHRVIVPAGRTGELILLDPISHKMDEVGGFSSQANFAGGHSEGVTSADVGRGAIFATDRDEKTLDLVDSHTRAILAKTKLAAEPDYVRYVASTNEVWVTEPRASQIEIFSLPEHGLPEPNSAGTIPIPGGPESLVIDNLRGRAYTNLWTNATTAIDLRKRAIVSQWPNGCHGSRGLALDRERGFLLVGCAEGKVESLAVDNGKRLGEAASGDGVDIIAYAPRLHHAYLPGAKSATMAVIDISAEGKPTVLATLPTASGGHCVTVDDLGNVYVCDPRAGQLMLFHDSIADVR